MCGTDLFSQLAQSQRVVEESDCRDALRTRIDHFSCVLTRDAADGEDG